MRPMPPSWPEANQKSATSSRPSVPRTRSTLSWASETEQETSAMMPFGKVRIAAAHSSTPVRPSQAVPATLTGSRNGLPATAPAIRRAIDTG